MGVCTGIGDGHFSWLRGHFGPSAFTRKREAGDPLSSGRAAPSAGGEPAWFGSGCSCRGRVTRARDTFVRRRGRVTRPFAAGASSRAAGHPLSRPLRRNLKAGYPPFVRFGSLGKAGHPPPTASSPQFGRATRLRPALCAATLANVRPRNRSALRARSRAVGPGDSSCSTDKCAGFPSGSSLSRLARDRHPVLKRE